jgi:phosphonoacetate hydrolase
MNPAHARSRVLVAMIDGLDPAYLSSDTMPHLTAFGAAGLATTVAAVMPTVTNPNNASIACAAWPSDHGITGNSYLDADSGTAVYMEDAASLTTTTVLERVGTAGGRSALLTAKVKTLGLLGTGVAFALAAEHPTAEAVTRYGPPPDIYTAEINHWLWTVAVDLLTTRPDLDLIYVHTTDFPMHAWPPGDIRSTAHLRDLDDLIAAAVNVADDIALYATADHGMNNKTRVWDLKTACAQRGAPIRSALSAERDRYVRHHRTFGGTAWAWVDRPEHTDVLIQTMTNLTGVEEVLTREEAARRFRLNPDRIGDLAVLGDRDTVFGDLMDPDGFEALPATYRSHGSRHEQSVPLIAFNTSAPYLRPPQANKDLLTPILDGWLGNIASGIKRS